MQCCHILFNYDIPWNPNRLEQRMGRIHRYGQRSDCIIFNFVALNTIEGRVLERLLTKLQEIRDALDDDAVFNVVGEVLPAAQIDRVFRDFYAGNLGEEDLEDRTPARRRRGPLPRHLPDRTGGPVDTPAQPRHAERAQGPRPAAAGGSRADRPLHVRERRRGLVESPAGEEPGAHVRLRGAHRPG